MNGTFVYTGAGRKQSENADKCVKECKQHACALQYCMAKNNHKQDRCEHFMTLWKECCEYVKSQDAKSPEVSQKQE